MEMERRNVGEKTMNTRETLVFKLNHWVPFGSLRPLIFDVFPEKINCYRNANNSED